MPELRLLSWKAHLVPMLPESVAELPEEELTPAQRKRGRKPLEHLESADQTEAIFREERLEW
jgi:hypothetical protein